MRTERFFTVVQRINALILLVLGTGGLILLGAGLWDLLAPSTRGLAPARVKVEVGRMGKDTLEFRCSGKVRGRHSFVLEAVDESGRTSFSGSSGGRGRVKNLLFVDLDTGETRWLLNGFDGYIPWNSLELGFGGGTSGENEELPPDAVLYLVIDSDTNGDGEVTYGDDGVLAVSDTNGSGYSVLKTGVRRVRYFEEDGGTAWVFFDASEGIMLARVDLAARKLDGVTRILETVPD